MNPTTAAGSGLPDDSPLSAVDVDPASGSSDDAGRHSTDTAPETAPPETPRRPPLGRAPTSSDSLDVPPKFGRRISMPWGPGPGTLERGVSYATTATLVPSPSPKEEGKGGLLDACAEEWSGTAAQKGRDELAEELLDTTRVLQEFGRVKKRNETRVLETETRAYEKWRMEDQLHGHTLRRLREWSDFQRQGVLKRIATMVRGKAIPEPPDPPQLKTMLQHHFPWRHDLRVRIIDFYDGRAEYMEITLKEIDKYIQEKPPGATVRWIHAPLGLGLLHSSVEDIFLNYRGRTAATQQGTTHSWPYQEIETVNIRSRTEYDTMRDIYKLRTIISSLTRDLDTLSTEGLSSALRNDIDWRAEHLGVKAGYWDLIKSDIPYELTQTVALQNPPGPLDGPAVDGLENEFQALWDHPFYENAHIVRNKFRTFHRADGVLLTMSSMSGVDFLDKDLDTYLRYSKKGREDSEDASVVGYIFKRFEHSGTRFWPAKTVEWFLVYLLTEMAVTPHTIRQGRNAVSLISAYQHILQKLKVRKYEAFKRNESVKLVRQYLACNDELSAVVLVLKDRITSMEHLLHNVQRMEELEQSATFRRTLSVVSAGGDNVAEMSTMNFEDEKWDEDPDACDSARRRIEWVLGTLRDDVSCYENLVEDLRLATQSLFQLRSIEQNELAIVADSQNKAILVFTGVTIVFLPLSFFTGYFGMNLKGIQNSEHGQEWFWKLCGTIAFVIILFSMMYAFRDRLRQRILRNGGPNV